MSVDVNFLQYIYTKVKLEDKLKGENLYEWVLVTLSNVQNSENAQSRYLSIDLQLESCLIGLDSVALLPTYMQITSYKIFSWFGRI